MVGVPERKHPVITAITSTPTLRGFDGFWTDIDMALLVER
jgi:hypothetical protein